MTAALNECQSKGFRFGDAVIYWRPSGTVSCRARCIRDRRCCVLGS